jgi:hypothetical protein
VPAAIGFQPLAQEFHMQDVMSQLVREGYIVPLGFGFFGCLIALTAIIARQWRSVRHAELESALKQKMLDQGLSADQIKIVLEATGRSARTKCDKE